MKWKFHNSIAFEIAILVLGGTVLVFSFVLAYSYIFSRRLILEEAEKNARNLTFSVARRIEQEFRAVAKVPQGLACVLETTRPDQQNLLKLLKRLVEENREVFGSCVAFEPYAFSQDVKWYCPYYYKKKDGIGFILLGPPSYDYVQYDWYQIPSELKTPIWTQPYFDEGGGDVLMTTYSVPFFQPSENGTSKKFRGIITADVSLTWLSDLVCSIQVARTGYCFIISDTGKFVTYPRPEFIMRESVFSLAEERHDPMLRNIGRAMIRERSGFTDIGKSLTGEEAFLAYARIPSTRWSLAAVFPKAELLAEVTHLHQTTVISAVVGLALLLLVSLLVARSIARPLRRIAGAAGRVAEGDLNIDLSDIKSTDEVGQLAHAFTRMTEGLKDREFIRDTFGRYLTREVVNRLLESKDGLTLGGEAREITLLMSDLRGFTALTARMDPKQVITFLNRYLGKMVEILLDHRGTIDEIIGDGILAFFGAPEPLEDHPARAVACALKMQAAMDDINLLNEAEGLPHLEMGIAVNTGDVVVGNIGSERRSKYGAVGSQVNFTGRVESFTVGGQVLISRSTYDRLSDLLQVKNELKVRMKGVPGTVTLYDVNGIRGPYETHLRERDETPRRLKERLKVHIYRLDEKIDAGTATSAWMTHFSRTSARLMIEQPLSQWEDVRILLLDGEQKPVEGALYAKVTAVSGSDNTWEATVRFTSIPPHAYRALQEAVDSDSGPAPEAHETEG